MLKRTMQSAVLGGAILLGACQQTVTLEQIQAATIAACAFRPTAVAITSAITNSPYVVDADAVAQAICAAVQGAGALQARRRGALRANRTITVPVVLPSGGTANVSGYFVR